MIALFLLINITLGTLQAASAPSLNLLLLEDKTEDWLQRDIAQTLSEVEHCYRINELHGTTGRLTKAQKNTVLQQQIQRLTDDTKASADLEIQKALTEKKRRLIEARIKLATTHDTEQDEAIRKEQEGDLLLNQAIAQAAEEREAQPILVQQVSLLPKKPIRSRATQQQREQPLEPIDIELETEIDELLILFIKGYPPICFNHLIIDTLLHLYNDIVSLGKNPHGSILERRSFCIVHGIINEEPLSYIRRAALQAKKPDGSFSPEKTAELKQEIITSFQALERHLMKIEKTTGSINLKFNTKEEAQAWVAKAKSTSDQNKRALIFAVLKRLDGFGEQPLKDWLQACFQFEWSCCFGKIH